VEEQLKKKFKFCNMDLDIENKNESLLFKFTPININLIRLLVNSEIWFSALDKLNDPFEGQFEIEKMELPSDEILTVFYQNSNSFSYSSEKTIERIEIIKENPAKFYEDIRTYLRKIFLNRRKIACFSLIYDEILMWSHYANEHKGICLIFDKELLISDDFFRKSNFGLDSLEDGKVLYKRRDNLKVNFDQNEILRVVIENFDELVIKKLDCWEYEKEYRIIATEKFSKASDGINFKFNKKALRGVIFGERSTYVDIKLMYSILTTYGYVDLDFLWGASRIVTTTGKLVTIKEYGLIPIEEFIGKRNNWLFQSFN
jgi:hypothetical protein